jgi:hypothetical protein
VAAGTAGASDAPAVPGGAKPGTKEHFKAQFEALVVSIWEKKDGAEYDTMLHLTSRGEEGEDAPADVNLRTADDGWTALMVACGNDAPEHVVR